MSGRYDSATRHLKECDPVLKRIIEEVGACTLKSSSNHFLTLIEAIVWQQLSWKAAGKIYDKLLAQIGTRRPKPADFLSASKSKLLRAGLSRRKADYVLEVSSYLESGRFKRDRIQKLTDEEAIRTLTMIRGVGRWTAEMFLVFGLNRMDVFPFGDLGLKKVVRRRYGLKGLPGKDELEDITRPWRPYRTVGAWYLWSSSDGTPMKDGGRK
jgi:DNA-3-methyladenine glycosylase II